MTVSEKPAPLTPQQARKVAVNRGGPHANKTNPVVNRRH